MDPYEGLPAVHDSCFVSLNIARTPTTLSLILDMREYRTGAPIRVSFPNISWMSANLLGCIIHEESAVDFIRRIPLEEVPLQYVVNDVQAFEVGLISGSSFRLVSDPPMVS